MHVCISIIQSYNFGRIGIFDVQSILQLKLSKLIWKLRKLKTNKIVVPAKYFYFTNPNSILSISFNEYKSFIKDEHKIVKLNVYNNQ